MSDGPHAGPAAEPLRRVLVRIGLDDAAFTTRVISNYARGGLPGLDRLLRALLGASAGNVPPQATTEPNACLPARGQAVSVA